MNQPKKQKQTLRQILRKKRSLLSNTELQQKSRQICKQIIDSELFKSARNVGFYHAVGGEADPSCLCQTHQNKQFFLPVLSARGTTDKPDSLLFCPISANTQYQHNRFKIPEPVYTPDQLITADELDLLIMPLVGFDKNGNRLGMGGGFYDRSLAFKQNQTNSKPALLGFAYDFQELEQLNSEPWDIRLEWIATESVLFKCRA